MARAATGDFARQLRQANAFVKVEGEIGAGPSARIARERGVVGRGGEAKPDGVEMRRGRLLRRFGIARGDGIDQRAMRLEQHGQIGPTAP